MNLLHYTTNSIQKLKQLPNHIFTGSSLIKKSQPKAKEIIKQHGEETYNNLRMAIGGDQKPTETHFAELYQKYNELADAEIMEAEPKNNADIRGRSMSFKTKSKIRKKILAWYLASQKKNKKGVAPLTFLTLTFVQPVSDETAVKMLNEFLTTVRQNNKGFIYLWVAEHQGNGRPHFHIINNKKWEIKKYRNIWHKIQENYGITHDNKDSCFDVEYLKSIRKTCVYVSKYITKNETKMKCLTWHCSRTISMLFTGFIYDESHQIAIQQSGKNYYIGLCKETGDMQAKIYSEWNHQEHYSLYPLYNNSQLIKHYSQLSEWNVFILDEISPYLEIQKEKSKRDLLRQSMYNNLLRSEHFTIEFMPQLDFFAINPF